MHADVADVLNRSADWLETHELSKGTFYNHASRDPGPNPRGGCLRGVIFLMCDQLPAFSKEGYTPLAWAAESAMRDYLRPELEKLHAPGTLYARMLASPDHPGLIAEWNNQPERTKAEVIEALRAAAVIEQSKAEELTPVA